MKMCEQMCGYYTGDEHILQVLDLFLHLKIAFTNCLTTAFFRANLYRRTEQIKALIQKSTRRNDFQRAAGSWKGGKHADAEWSGELRGQKAYRRVA